MLPSNQIKADSCERAPTPLPHLASNSSTIAMPINLMTQWLFWISSSPCWTPSSCYSMCCRWLRAGGGGGTGEVKKKNHTVRQNAHKPSWAIHNVSPTPPPTRHPSSVFSPRIVLQPRPLGLQVIGNGTDPSWAPRLPSWSVNVVRNHTSGDEL